MNAEFVYIPFTVREDNIEMAKSAIREFISHIRIKEPGTLLYASLQERDQSNRFAHFMAFANSDSHQKHRGTEYVEEFVKKLYPLCSKDPNPIFLDSFDICGKAAAEIIKAG
jgi:quinol monooxygenase YgiN